MISKIPTRNKFNFQVLPHLNSSNFGAVLVWVGLVYFNTMGSLQYAEAQRSKEVKAQGEYQMKVELSVNMDQARTKAIQLARIDALRRVFGEVVVQGNSTFLKNSSNGELNSSTSAFNLISESLVNGEWISDIEEPTITTSNKSNGTEDEIWIHAKVYGWVRELDPVVQNCDVQPLSCPKISCKTSQFNHGQSFYLAFQSPVNGYLTVYLDNPEEQTTYKILPYSAMKGDLSIPIIADKPYVFFDAGSKSEYNLPQTEELELFIGKASNPQELNKLFVIFSPNHEIGKPILSNSSSQPIQEGNSKFFLPPNLPSEDFQRWLNTLRSKNRQIQLYTEILTINR